MTILSPRITDGIKLELVDRHGGPVVRDDLGQDDDLDDDWVEDFLVVEALLVEEEQVEDGK